MEIWYSESGIIAGHIDYSLTDRIPVKHIYFGSEYIQLIIIIIIEYSVIK